MQTLGVGIIGFGFMGRVHAYSYLNLPIFYDPVPVRTRLVGVADPKPDRSRQVVEQLGFEFITPDWRELLAREDIQIIDICSPNSRHAEQLLAAINSNKHIYCDKPLAVGEENFSALETALKKNACVGQMALQYRFFPATLRAKQLTASGFIGEVISFRATYLHSGSVDPRKPMGWKQLKSEGGGVLQDLGSHIVDLVDYLIGPLASLLTQTRILHPRRPNASGEMVPVEADDMMLMTAKLHNGAVGTIEASKIATGAEDELRFEIHGDKGALRFNSMDPNYLEAYDLGIPDTPLGGGRGWCKIACVQRYERPGGFPGPKFSIGWIRAHLHSLYNFLEAVRDGKEAHPSLAEGLRLQRILSLAEKSALTGAWQPVPGP
jgi:predicted dehydrogenase